MRITFVISSLAGGGAERVASVMANYWAEKGWMITILVVSSGRSPAYDLHPQIACYEMNSLLPSRSLGLPQEPLARLINECSRAERAVVISELGLIMALGHAIRATSPEVVISFLDITNIRVLLATLGSGLTAVVTEHSDPFYNSIGEGREGLRRRLYPNAKCVAVLTEDSARYFRATIGDSLRVIPNPVLAPARAIAGKKKRAGGFALLAMGRLAPEKGFDLLLRAFATLAKKHPRWNLEIWGEGPLRQNLMELAEQLGLSKRVRLPGFAKRPYEVMQRADLFVVSSHCEGFSNVLVEAMACGLAAVSFDCPSGPRHIIRNAVDGILTPAGNIAALAAALDQLMKDDHKRSRLASRAPEVIERFGAEKVMAMWEEIICDQGA